MNYPRELRPRPEYSLLLPSDVCDRYLIRETHFDLYTYIKNGNVEDRDDFNSCSDEILKNYIDYPTTSKEVYELSLYLYGDFNRNHLGLRLKSKEDVIKYQYQNWAPGKGIPTEDIECSKDDSVFPIFFEANKLIYDYSFQDKATNSVIEAHIAFEHLPNLINYWHFQLFATDDNIKLTRNIVKEKYSRLAKAIIRELFVKAVVLDDSCCP